MNVCMYECMYVCALLVTVERMQSRVTRLGTAIASGNFFVNNFDDYSEVSNPNLIAAAGEERPSLSDSTVDSASVAASEDSQWEVVDFR